MRLSALRLLAASGDERARARLAVEVRMAAGSGDARARSRAAQRTGPAGVERSDGGGGPAGRPRPLGPASRPRCRPTRGRARRGPAIASLDDPRTHAAAAGAIDRLGDAVVAPLAEALDAPVMPVPPTTRRLVRAARTRSPARDVVLLRNVGHRDRELGLQIMERLAGPAPADPPVAAALDAVLADDARQAARVLAAIVALESPDAGADEPEAALRRALDDELALLGRRIGEGRLVVHGTERVGPPLRGVATGGRQAGLAVEAVEVALSPDEARTVLATVQPNLTPGERLARLPAHAAEAPGDADGWLRDLVEDRHDDWRSPWLRACAIRAARLTGRLGGIDLGRARALGDPVVDEELALAATGPP